MFTGLIHEIGTIAQITLIDDSMRLQVTCAAAADAELGESISINGVCLTVVETDGHSFVADVMAQTLAVTTLGQLGVNQRVNVERAMTLGDQLGGHIVQGHIDGTATVLEVREHEQWRVVRFTLPDDVAALVVDKGSIALDGVSLTVSNVGMASGGYWAEVSLIPETLSATTLGQVAVGDQLNVETDVLARHVQRLMQFGAVHADGTAPSTTTAERSPMGFTATPEGSTA